MCVFTSVKNIDYIISIRINGVCVSCVGFAFGV